MFFVLNKQDSANCVIHYVRFEDWGWWTGEMSKISYYGFNENKLFTWTLQTNNNFEFQNAELFFSMQIAACTPSSVMIQMSCIM